ncbi:MAG: dUTP pyrophosphatase [Pyrinomonadaceae bacterium]|jgi:dUTP pyrophosphatase|nr:dUTP pyrophosphatase [Pyrinomonadaceae bacterium]
MTNELKFLKLHPAATLPTRGSEHAAGLDLYALEDVTLEAGGGRAMVRTGLSVAIPRGFYGRVAPRSGLAVKHGLDVLAGVIDSDYRGELLCALVNHGRESLTLEAGQRVAQLIVEAIITPAPAWADALDETARGAGGFGSTGRG